jgi:monodictyphenone polyketide synthase
MSPRYHEHRTEIPLDTQNADLCAAGLGTGLLSAAAVSLSHTLADLPIAGSEAVRIAFRLGLVVNEVSQNLQPSTGAQTGDSWAYVVPGVSHEVIQNELDAIQEAEVCRIILLGQHCSSY